MQLVSGKQGLSTGHFFHNLGALEEVGSRFRPLGWTRSRRDIFAELPMQADGYRDPPSDHLDAGEMLSAKPTLECIRTQCRRLQHTPAAAIVTMLTCHDRTYTVP